MIRKDIFMARPKKEIPVMVNGVEYVPKGSPVKGIDVNNVK